jgi:hypothetical protein
MARKKAEDLLGPIGDEGADYIRGRLKKRVLLELGITMRRKEVDLHLRCLDEKASYKRIRALFEQALAEISSPVWNLEIEPLLVEFHGAWRYEGRPQIHVQDLDLAARRYAISHTMDALLSDCSFPMVRTREERLDDAAWYAVDRKDRAR